MLMTSTRTRFTLKQLHYFRSVAQTGQISLAAAEENVTQSAMTASIAQLESGLGTLLFERSRSGVSLTHAGHLFLQHATRVLEAAEDAASHPFQEPQRLRGVIVLAASYTVLGYFILPYLSRFQKQYPEVRVVPQEMDRGLIERRLEDGSLGMAVALTSNMEDLRRFSKISLARSRRQLWVAHSHPLAELSQASLKDVAASTYIVPTVDDGELASSRYWRDAKLKPSSTISTTSMEAVREMVALGLGVTILSDMVYRPWSLDGRKIQTVPLKGAIPPMEVGLLWKRGRRLSPAEEALSKFLSSAVA